MKMKFGDMKIGQLFFAWGDSDLGFYDFAKACNMKKTGLARAEEIVDDSSGVSFLMSDGDEFQIINM